MSFYFPTLAPYIATGLGIATSCCILCCECNQLAYFISLSGFYPASAHHCNSFHAESQCCAHPQLAGFSRRQGDISSERICDMHTGLQANCVPAQILEVISYFIEARMCGQFGSRLTEPSKRLDSRLLRSHTLCEP